ncbi:MAG: YigZ family protein [Oscillospiraceae bacterium]
MTCFQTIKEAAVAEFIEKKSRFIGYSMPVKTQDEALQFVEKIKKQNRDATHNTFAYLLKTGEKKYSDNGEPQGTAGIPILNVIEKSNLVDICIVVTRYFGGILLGAGGLVRAYSHSAAIAVSSSTIISLKNCVEFQFAFHYTLYGKLSKAFDNYPLKILSNDFSDKVSTKILIEKEFFEKFKADMVELSNGKISTAEFKTNGEYFYQI